MINKLVKIILTLLILIIVAGIILTLLWSSTFANITFLQSIFPKELEDTGADESVIETFNSFIENSDECKQLDKEKCFCDALLELSPNYILNVNKENIKLVRGENELATTNYDFTCILDFKKNELTMLKKDPFFIKFDEAEPYIVAKRISIIPDFKASFYSNYPMLYKFNKDELCWVTEKVDEDKVKYIKECIRIEIEECQDELNKINYKRYLGDIDLDPSNLYKLGYLSQDYAERLQTYFDNTSVTDSLDLIFAEQFNEFLTNFDNFFYTNDLLYGQKALALGASITQLNPYNYQACNLVQLIKKITQKIDSLN